MFGVIVAIGIGQVDEYVTGIAWHNLTYERMQCLNLAVENLMNHNRVTYTIGGWLKL